MDRIKKLNTREDKFNIHKILGITCLIHYIYRYYQLIIHGSSHLEDLSLVNIFLVSLHALLSTSSLIFNVLRNRNLNHSFIYKEQRFQSIIFTLRAYSAYMCLLTCKYYNVDEVYCTVLRFICIIMWHPFVDYAAKLYKNEDSGTLVRGSDKLYETRASRKTYIVQKFTKHSMVFASAAQIFVTGTLIYDPASNLFNIAFFNMLPIQVPLFLSTLVKKGFISNSTNNICYILLLIVAGTTKTYTVGNFVGLLFVCFIRFKLHFNKYALWALYTIISIIFIQQRQFSQCFID